MYHSQIADGHDGGVVGRKLHGHTGHEVVPRIKRVHRQARAVVADQLYGIGDDSEHDSGPRGISTGDPKKDA